jgi:hypothetical protein
MIFNKYVLLGLTMVFFTNIFTQPSFMHTLVTVFISLSAYMVVFFNSIT